MSVDFISNGLADYLYTSKKLKRFNLASDCLYFCRNEIDVIECASFVANIYRKSELICK